MPIDITLLRPTEEGGNINEVKRWQLCRLNSNSTQKDSDSDSGSEDEMKIQSLVAKIAHLEKEKRRLVKESCQCRARLKHLQSLLAPKKNKKKEEKKKKKKECNECNNNGNLSSTAMLNLNSNDDDEDDDEDETMIREEIALLKKEQIPLLTEQVEQITKMLELHSPKLMNIVVDCKSFPAPAPAPAPAIENIDRAVISEPELGAEGLFIDPLYCIGAYEKISIPTTVHHMNISNDINNTCTRTHGANIATLDQEKALLSGFGSIISDALCSYAKKFVQQFDIVKHGYGHGHGHGQLQYLDVPATVPLQPPSLVHSVMGYHEGFITPGHEADNCGDGGVCGGVCGGYSTIESTSTCVPSNIVSAMVHRNKTFTDRELPKTFISSTSFTSEEANIQIGHKKLSLAHTTKRIEVTLLSACNLGLSTEAQDGMVKNILEFYQSLLTTSTDITNLKAEICHLESKGCSSSSSNRETPLLLRARCVIPSELEPNEARRIIIEGFLPSTKSYIYLGHVSNYTDYISRALKIKCGGRNGQPTEYAHLIHGTILCCHGALQWCTENNIVSVKTGGDTPPSAGGAEKMNTPLQRNGILIPPSLKNFMNVDTITQGFSSKEYSDTLLFIPFIRELVRRKGGKICSNEFIRGSKGHPTWLHSRKDTTLQHRTDGRNHNRGNIAETNTEQNLKLQLPSVKDEAACNPYDFLPLYQN